MLNDCKANYWKWREEYGEGIAVIMVVLYLIIFLLLMGAVYLGIAGLISLVYGAFAEAFKLPTVTIWTWWDLILLIRVIYKFVDN